MELSLHLKMLTELPDDLSKLLPIIFEMPWKLGNVSDANRKMNIALKFKTYQRNDPKKSRLVSLADRRPEVEVVNYPPLLSAC